MTGRQGGSGFWRHATAFRRLGCAVLLLALLLTAAALFMPHPATLSSLPKATVSSITVVAKLDSFPLAANAWRDELDLDGEVPASGYAAHYLERYRLDDNKRRRIIARENVPIVNSRGVPEAHNIIPEAFGAYWVGRLHITQTRHYSPPQNSDGVNMRILLNGHVIHQTRRSDGSLKKPLPVYLQPGDYLLEIELGGLPPRTDFFPHE